MKTEYRAILAIVLSAGFFILWSTVISPPKRDVSQPPAVEQTQAAQAATAEAPAASPAAVPAAAKAEAPSTADPQAALPIKTVAIKNDLIAAEVTTDGGDVTSWKVLDYKVGTDKASPPIDLAANAPGLPPAMALSLDAGSAMPDRPRFEVAQASEASVTLRWRSRELEVEKTIALTKGSYAADVSVEIRNKTDRALAAKPALAWSGVNLPQKQSGFLSFLKGGQTDLKAPVFYVGGKVQRAPDVKAQTTLSGSVLWGGIESRYFLSAVIPRVQGDGLGVTYGGDALAGGEAGTRGVWTSVALPAMTVLPGEAGKAAFSVYAGPKEINLLKALNVHLDEAIDYGWFTIIAVPILYLLKFFYGIISNYGVAIILLTIVVKLLLHPINVKSLKSMKAMQQLQPRLKEIQQKYKDDKQKLNVETMQLFRAHKVNPMGGCLPMLLQLPIYIALYKVLWSSIELYHAPFFWFYRDLSAPDPYLVTPILLGIFMVAQQMVTPSASADPAQKKMMMFMPIMFTGFMLFLPVGLVIYILVNTVMSVTQQYMYNHGIGFMDVMRGKWKPKKAHA